MSPQAISFGRRQPAAHQLPALPVRRFHHLAVRHFPVTHLRNAQWPIHSSPKSGSSRSTSRPGAGPGATVSCCRCRRTRRCSRCSARPMAATARATSLYRTCRAGRRCIPGQGPGLSLHDLGRDGRVRDGVAARIRDPVALAMRCARHDMAIWRSSTLRRRIARSLKSASDALSVDHEQTSSGDARQRSRPRRRRSAAQQPAAVSDVLLLHRPAGRLPAADLSRRR